MVYSGRSLGTGGKKEKEKKGPLLADRDRKNWNKLLTDRR